MKTPAERTPEKKRIVATEKRTVLVVHNVPDTARIGFKSDGKGTLKITIDK